MTAFEGESTDHLLRQNEAILITLGRIYDALAVLADATSPEAWSEVEDKHAQGKFFLMPPFVTDEPYDYFEAVDEAQDN